MNNLLLDLRVGLRQFTKSPGNLLLAVVAYAVGLGLVGLMLTLIFGVLHAQPKGIDLETIQILNWDESTEHLWTNGAQNTQIRYRDYRDLAEEQDVMNALAATRGATFSVVLGKFAERFDGSYVTTNFFKALEATPEIGQFFEEGDDYAGAESKAVISYKLWQNHFAGQSSVIGRSAIINGAPATIVGVARDGFDFPGVNDVWMNERIDYLALDRAEGDAYFVFGQLKDNQTVASALSSLNTIAKRFEQAYPETNTGYIAFTMVPLSSLYLGEGFEMMTYLMLACSGLVLFIACTNVANLTLSRATTRVKELAIRTALGGKRSRLIIQMVVEGFSIAIFGGIGGLLIAIWTSKAIWAWVNKGGNANVPDWMNMDVDFRVIVYLSIATLIASVLASIIPAMQASRTDVNEILKDNSRGSTGLKIGVFSKLITLFQLCVSCGLLIATSALVSTSKETAVFEPPYDPEGMMTARFELPETRFPSNTLADTLIDLQKRLENNPALEGVGFTTAQDMMFNWPSSWEVRGHGMVSQDDYTQGRHEIVSDNYFELLGIPILYGRGFDSLDRSANAEQVCVINQVLADRIWPDPDNSPIGQQIRDVWSSANPWLTIIGVVPDTKMAGPGPQGSDELGGVYRPMSNSPQASVTVFSKTSGNPLIQAQQIRSILHELDESIVLYRVKTVEQAIEERNFGPLFFRNMFGLFGIAALALASIGVYGVINFSVRQRFQEFGIRQALGAVPGNIMSQVFKMGILQISIGLILGSTLGWGLTIAIRQGTNEIMIVSVSNYLIPIFILTAIASLALYIPARFATKTNLSACLREE